MDPKIPLVGWIGRLDFQKGPDVVLQSIEPMAQRGCQVHSVSCLTPRLDSQLTQLSSTKFVQIVSIQICVAVIQKTLLCTTMPAPLSSTVTVIACKSRKSPFSVNGSS